MKSENEQRVALTIKVPPQLIERLEKVAADLDVSRSEAGYRALRNGITEMEGVTESPVGGLVLAVGELLADRETRQEISRIRKNLNARKRRMGKEATT